jgi:DNA repair exonuclease SbcCD nuclease subunit
MRRLTAWIGGAASGVAAYRFLRRQRTETVPPEPEATEEPDERAEELRTKLAESRAAEPVVEEEAVAEPESPSPEERRQRVHEEGRATLDEMKPE